MKNKAVFAFIAIGAILIIGVAILISKNREVEVVSSAGPEPVQQVVEPADNPVNSVTENQESFDMEQSEPEMAAQVPEQVAQTVAIEPVEAAQEIIAEPTQIMITVVEQGTGMELPRVRISHEFAGPDAVEVEEENEDRQRGGRGFRGRSNDDSTDSVRTDNTGYALITLSEEETDKLLARQNMSLNSRWGVGPRHQSVSLDIKPNQVNEITIEYPKRSTHTVTVTDEMENPVTDYDLTLNVQQYSFWEGGDIFMEQNLVTDSEGMAEFLAYPQRQSLLQVIADDVALFKAESGRRGDQLGNPLSMRTRINEDENINVILLDQVVKVNARLVNEPFVTDDKERMASIESSDEDSDIDYWMIPVEEDTFTFSVPVGNDVEVFLSQRVASGETDSPRNMRQRFSQSPSVELKQLIEIPDEPGEINVDLVYPDRQTLTATVYMPNGEPAENVKVRALGFSGDSSQPEDNGRQRRWDQFLGRIEGSTSIVSQATGSNGKTELELPPASSYIFEAEPDSLPEDAKGREPLELTWEEIEGGEEIVIMLLPSSLLWGEVRDWNGQPVSNATVHLRGPDIPWNDLLFQTETDENGLFELNVPPVRLTQPDPEEPPEYYVFANSRNYGGGLGKAVIDNPEEAVEISINPFASLRVDVLNGGEVVTNIEFEQLYDVPGFSQPISSRNSGSRSEDDGSYRFGFLIEEISTVSIFDLSNPNAFFVIPIIPEQVGDDFHVAIDFSNPEGGFTIVEEDDDSDPGDNNERRGPGGGGPGS